MTLPVILLSLLFAALGNVAIYLMVTTINGQLLPNSSFFSWFYTATERFQLFGFPWLRLLIAVNTLGLLANIFIPLAYRVGGPGIGGTAYVTFGVVGMAVLAFLLNPALKFGWDIRLSLALLTLMAGIVAWQLR